MIPSGQIAVGVDDLFVVHTDGDLYLHPGILSGSGDTAVRIADREDPRVSLGDGHFPNTIDQVAGEADGAVYFSDCCEPVAGNVHVVTQADSTEQLFASGSSPRLSPDRRRLGTANSFGVAVVDLGEGTQRFVSLNLSGPYLNVWDALWSADGESLYVLYFDDAGYGVLTFDSDTLAASAPERIDLPFVAPGEPDARFAGRGPNGELAISVTSDESTEVEFFDPTSLQRVVALDRTLPAGTSSVRIAPDDRGLLWVDDESLYYLPDGASAINLGASYLSAWFTG
ncbi:MAG: hypothetical protein WAS51_15575 [Ilumatobacteraceae bacterium]